jgi:hypothetical protein
VLVVQPPLRDEGFLVRVYLVHANESMVEGAPSTAVDLATGHLCCVQALTTNSAHESNTPRYQQVAGRVRHIMPLIVKRQLKHPGSQDGNTQSSI